jgi:hypothetical protein
MVPRSSMWDHVIKIKDNKGRLKSAKCKYCQHILKVDSNQHGTSSLKNILMSTSATPINLIKTQSKVLCKQPEGKLLALRGLIKTH